LSVLETQITEWIRDISEYGGGQLLSLDTRSYFRTTADEYTSGIQFS
jgi:hypothetical protein